MSVEALVGALVFSFADELRDFSDIVTREWARTSEKARLIVLAVIFQPSYNDSFEEEGV